MMISLNRRRSLQTREEQFWEERWNLQSREFGSAVRPANGLEDEDY